MITNAVTSVLDGRKMRSVHDVALESAMPSNFQPFRKRGSVFLNRERQPNTSAWIHRPMTYLAVEFMFAQRSSDGILHPSGRYGSLRWRDLPAQGLAPTNTMLTQPRACMASRGQTYLLAN